MAVEPSPVDELPRPRGVRGQLATLGRQTVVYGVAGAASQAVGLVTLPIFARALSPSQYGVLEVATVGYSALLILADTGLTSGAQRNYYDYDESQDRERRSTLATGMVTTFVVGAALAFALVMFASRISNWAYGTPDHATLVRIVALTLPLGAVGAYVREAMRLKFRAWHYTICALLASVVAAAISVVAVVVLHKGVTGVVFGTLLGSGLAALYGFSVSTREVTGRFSWSELYRMCAYAGPLIPAAGAMWVMNFVDRLILSHLGSLAETGQYAVANRFAFAPLLLVTAFNTAFGPFQLTLWRDDPESEKRVRDHALTYLTVLLVLCGVILSVFAREIVAVIAPKFDPAYQIVGLLVIAVVFWGICNIVLFGLSLMRRTTTIAIFTGLAALVNVAANFALIPVCGIIGASVANLLSYLVLTVAYFVTSQRLYHTHYSLRKPLQAIIFGAAAMASGAMPLPNTAASFGIKLGVVVAFLLTLRITRVIDDTEVRELRVIARRARARVSGG